MKKLLVGGLVGASLAGCVSPASDMMNNQYMVVQPSPQSFSGYWTGNIGPGLITLKVNKDGTGLYCESAGNDVNTRLYQVKITQDMVYLSNGTRIKIDSIDNNNANLKNIYLGMNIQYKLYKDDALTMSAPLCKKQLIQ